VHRPLGRFVQTTGEEYLQLLLDQLNPLLSANGVATACKPTGKIKNALANHRSFLLACDLPVKDAKIVFKERVNALTAGQQWGDLMRHEPPWRTTWQTALDGVREEIFNPMGVELLNPDPEKWLTALSAALETKSVLTPEEWNNVSTFGDDDGGVAKRIDLQPHHVVKVRGGYRSPVFDFPNFRAATIECTFVVGKWELSATVPFELATLRRPSDGPFYAPELAEATAKWASDNRGFVDNILAELRGQVADARVRKEEMARETRKAAGLTYTAPKKAAAPYLADFEAWCGSFTFARTSNKRKRDEGSTSAEGATSAEGEALARFPELV